MTDRERRLIEAQIRLKTARAEMVTSAALLDRESSRESHQRIMASIAANDLAQESVAKELIEPFETSIPERCDYVDHLSSIPANMDRRCMKEEGHEGPHMFGELDPPPAA